LPIANYVDSIFTSRKHTFTNVSVHAGLFLKCTSFSSFTIPTENLEVTITFLPKKL